MSLVLRTVSEPTIVTSGTLAFGSATVTGIASTAALSAGQAVQGTGIPSGTLILSITSPTQITLTQNAQANGPTSLTFPVEPLTLAEAKAHLRVTIDDFDDYIVTLIPAARRALETHSHRAFISTTFDALWDSFPFGGGYYNRQLRQFYGAFPGAMGATFPGFLPTNTGIIEVPRSSLQSVTSITYYDGNGALQTLDPSVYDVETGNPGRIAPRYGQIWPTTLPRIGAVTIRFVSGYGDTADTVPANAKHAMKLLIGNWYENRESAVIGTIVSPLVDAIDSLMAAEDWGAYA